MNSSTVYSKTRFVISIFGILAALTFISAADLFVQNAYAAGGTLDEEVCEALGGSWVVDTCTVTTTANIDLGETLTIPSGITLVIANDGSTGQEVGLTNRGTMVNDGTINVLNTGGTGLNNVGTGNFTNSGELSVSNTGTSDGLLNHDGGKVQNSGSIDVSNTGGTGVDNFNIGTFTNTGEITLSNSNGTGLNNEDNTLIISETGTITVSNTGGTGIRNLDTGTITNSGELTVSNTGNSLGIHNVGTGIISNSATGTLTIGNSGDLSRGLRNHDGGKVENSGVLIVSNSGGFGIVNENVGRIVNNATLTVSNSGGVGIDNEDSFVTNEGTVTVQENGVFNNAVDGIINTVNGQFIVECRGTLNNSGTITGTITNTPCDPVDETQRLIDSIKSDVTDKKVRNSLLGPLKEVQKILGDSNPNNDGAACDKLANFIANVNSKEASGKLSSSLAQEYRDAANAIQSLLGC